jgi:hypothetical protein
MTTVSLLIPTTLAWARAGGLAWLRYPRRHGENQKIVIPAKQELDRKSEPGLRFGPGRIRTNDPRHVKQWGLRAGDKLDWSLEARRDEIVILVKKAETKSGKKKV